MNNWKWIAIVALVCLSAKTALSQTEGEGGEPTAMFEADEPPIIVPPEIPPPSVYSRPVLRRLPSVFKDVVPDTHATYDKTGLDAGRRRNFEETPVMTLTSYVVNTKPEGVGIVSEIEEAEAMAGETQTLFISATRELRTGEILNALMVRENVKGENGSATVLEVGGVVRVMNRVDDKTNSYRARVVRSINPVQRGAILVPGTLPQADMRITGARSSVQAKVIGGEFDKSRRVLGPGAVVYLSKGAAEGLKMGDLLAVQSVRQSRKPNTLLPKIETPIGVLKVVQVESQVATAFVLQSVREIEVGDQTGGAFPDSLIEPLPSRRRVIEVGIAD